MSDKPIKPGIYFRVSEIPINLPENIREDLKAIARLGDGKKKYDDRFDSSDLQEFYRLNPIADNFRVKDDDLFYPNFNKHHSEDYKELYQKLKEIIYICGSGTLAQFSIHDPNIPVDYRRLLRDEEINEKFLFGQRDIVEDMDIYTYVSARGFPLSQLVSLNTFRTANGYSFDRLFQYLTNVRSYLVDQKEYQRPQEFVYSGRLIKDILDIPFSDDYTTPEKLLVNFNTLLQDPVYTLFNDYPRIGLIDSGIIAAVKGSTGYYLYDTEQGANAIPITNTTYLFFSDKAEEPTYRVTLDLKGTSTIEQFNSQGKLEGSVTFTLIDRRAKDNLFVMLQKEFNAAKESTNYNRLVIEEARIAAQIEETSDTDKKQKLQQTLQTKKEEKKEKYKKALNLAFTNVLTVLNNNGGLIVTKIGNIDVTKLQEMLNDLPYTYVPNIYFNLIKN